MKALGLSNVIYPVSLLCFTYFPVIFSVKSEVAMHVASALEDLTGRPTWSHSLLWGKHQANNTEETRGQLRSLPELTLQEASCAFRSGELQLLPSPICSEPNCRCQFSAHNLRVRFYVWNRSQITRSLKGCFRCDLSQKEARQSDPSWLILCEPTACALPIHGLCASNPQGNQALLILNSLFQCKCQNSQTYTKN